VEVRRSHCDLGATSLREWRGGGVGLTRSSVTRATRRSGHPGGWADWRAGGRTGGDTFGGTGRGADRRSCRNIRGWAAGRAIGWACRNVLGWADRGAGRWTSGKAVGRSRRNALGNPWGRACSQHLRRRRVLAPRTFVGMRSRFIGTRRRDNASLGISRVGRRPGEDGRSGATVVVQNVALDWRLVERTVGSAPDGERQRLVVPVRRLLRLRPPLPEPDRRTVADPCTQIRPPARGVGQLPGRHRPLSPRQRRRQEGSVPRHTPPRQLRHDGYDNL
jgi:hypothetical protein